MLHSDQPFSDAAAIGVLQLAAKKLSRSTLYSPERERNIYVCNSRWRQRLFFHKDYDVGGVAPYPVTANVFLRDARIEDNHLISPRGTPVMGSRTLDYFVAHEITYQLTGEALGPFRYFRLPQWVREGYADYIGKGSTFDYAGQKLPFLRRRLKWIGRDRAVLAFHLLVAYLLDHRHLSVRELLTNPADQADVEDAVRREK